MAGLWAAPAPGQISIATNTAGQQLLLKKKAAEAKKKDAEARKQAEAKMLAAKKKLADDSGWVEGSKYPAGSLAVNTPQRNLYLVLGSGKARRCRIGCEGFQSPGNSKIIAKAEWPGWTPPKAMIEREAATQQSTLAPTPQAIDHPSLQKELTPEAIRRPGSSPEVLA